MSEQLSLGASIILSNNPVDYSKVRFDAVDILYVGSFCVQKDKTFDFDGDAKALLPLFQSVVKIARDLNPNIQIIIMQSFGDGTTIDQLANDNDIQTYANSMAQFIANHNLDGYSNNYQSGNVCPQAAKVFAAVRQSLDKIRATPPYHVSVSPTTSQYLDDDLFRSSLNYVNIQCFWERNPAAEQAINEYQQIFKGTNVKIIFGVNTETAGLNWSLVAPAYNVFDTLYDIVTHYGLDGIYTWRIDSGDWVYQNAFQVYLYNRLHGTDLQSPFTRQLVMTTWPQVGGGPIPPFQ